MDIVENLLSRLDKVKSKGNDRWTACCAAHDDKTPSLAISVINGKVLLNCFSGCAAVDIVHAVGLDMCDLFPEGGASQFQGFIQLQREIATKQLKKEATEAGNHRDVLRIANNMRANGEILTIKDLEKEKQAFLKIREIESSENINR